MSKLKLNQVYLYVALFENKGYLVNMPFKYFLTVFKI